MNTSDSSTNKDGRETGLSVTAGSALELAFRFHETYERLAPLFGYETRVDTKGFNPFTPNGRLMIAVCSELSVPQSPREALAYAAFVERWMNSGPNTQAQERA